ncbi:four-helix bundle copper-binding protein [Actinocorallia sp. A-T 12471]|uniref:four-helix bundle copper-binding protein n=1 Tax=Actinocorallia sp. A-T 12471 TaxID=3089813 RepID=UPI0029D327BB|nr:four-helix bundle copper-binding protein [Actinocorallia sp. A-T 12471]MDX6742344.1 four-helix bundle copper-binding protein [Actinocorallia sp. A-T 12471]
MPVLEMIRTYPADITLDRDLMADAVSVLIDCAQACTACADACLSEPDVALLGKCIRTNLDCADICATTAKVLSRHTGYDANMSVAQLRSCAVACKTCADECAVHADRHAHCRVCAEACRTCAATCENIMDAMITS